MPDNSTHKLPTLAILGGTGKEGTGLALRWAGAGYQVIIGSRQTEKALSTAADLNAKLGISSISGMENAHAARHADMCILTVVESAHQSALHSLKDVLQGKLLVDATARVDFRHPRPPNPPAAARVAQDILGTQVRVVAAFQNVPAHALKRNLGEKMGSDVLVCADEVSAAEEVIRLAEAAGMQAYYAGGLDNAIVVEGLTSLLISLNVHYGVKSASISVSGVDTRVVDPDI